MVIIAITNREPPVPISPCTTFPFNKVRAIELAMIEPSLGLYVHIPFCIQRCSYCDFATYAKNEIEPNQEYVDTLLLEASKRQNIFTGRNLKTIYFGGGTPSLLEASQIAQIIQGVLNLGFTLDSDAEVTLEVNPATLNEQKCFELSQAGVNRLSIGCQSFDDKYLKICNREHNSKDTLNTIELTKKYFDNYSLDLLFSLPEQGLKQIKQDLAIIKEIDPPHISAYCLTLADKHPMNQNRCSEDEQIEMFSMIFNSLKNQGLERYEISNFAKPGHESKHNSLYWDDSDYWGIGLSAHSYKRNPGWGARFWNPSNYKTYVDSIKMLTTSSEVQTSFGVNSETLRAHESLTDFCHTHLRMNRGLDKTALRHKFGAEVLSLVERKMALIEASGWVVNYGSKWVLSHEGLLLSNQVFANLLFNANDIDKIQNPPKL